MLLFLMTLEKGWKFAKCYKAGGLKSWDVGLYVDDDEESSVYWSTLLMLMEKVQMVP